MIMKSIIEGMELFDFLPPLTQFSLFLFELLFENGQFKEIKKELKSFAAQENSPMKLAELLFSRRVGCLLWWAACAVMGRGRPWRSAKESEQEEQPTTIHNERNEIHEATNQIKWNWMKFNEFDWCCLLLNEWMEWSPKAAFPPR